MSVGVRGYVSWARGKEHGGLNSLTMAAMIRTSSHPILRLSLRMAILIIVVASATEVSDTSIPSNVGPRLSELSAEDNV